MKNREVERLLWTMLLSAMGVELKRAKADAIVLQFLTTGRGSAKQPNTSPEVLSGTRGAV